ncbi:MAG: hypothetical protein ACYCYE_15295 [Clostridia bacterium]
MGSILIKDAKAIITCDKDDHLLRDKNILIDEVETASRVNKLVEKLVSNI